MCASLWRICLAAVVLMCTPCGIAFFIGRHGPKTLGMTTSRISEIVLRGSAPDDRVGDVLISKVLPEKEYLRRIADFLTRNLYAEEMPLGQRKQLRELEFKDLDKRYGERMGKKKFPSTMILAVEEQDIVGTSGVDCQVMNTVQKRFREIKPGGTNALFSMLEEEGQEEVVCVVANLAVRKNMRGRGIARKMLGASDLPSTRALLCISELTRTNPRIVSSPTSHLSSLFISLPASCEASAKEWGYSYLYLLVDSDNKAAQRLYQKAGYSLFFVQEDATCVVSGPLSLKTQDCINYCMRKNLRGAGGGGGGAGILNSLFAAFSGKK